MTITTNLIAELIRAANAIGRVNVHEKRRLLQSALSCIGALADLMTKSGLKVSLDGASLRARSHIASNLDRFSDTTIARTMLALANELRMLRVRHRSFVTSRRARAVDHGYLVEAAEIEADMSVAGNAIEFRRRGVAGEQPLQEH